MIIFSRVRYASWKQSRVLQSDMEAVLHSTSCTSAFTLEFRCKAIKFGNTANNMILLVVQVVLFTETSLCTCKRNEISTKLLEEIFFRPKTVPTFHVECCEEISNFRTKLNDVKNFMDCNKA